MKKIAVEEHFFTPGYIDFLRKRSSYPRLAMVDDGKNGPVEALWTSPSTYKVQDSEETEVKLDVGERRLKAMDEAGIDMQVLSLAAPVELFNPAEGLALTRQANDELAAIVARHPDRFAGLAALPMQEPLAAAAELERAVNQLGLKGAKVNAHLRDEYFDARKFWIIFETAERLDVPLYLHPMQSPPEMMKLFSPFPALSGPIFGFSVNAALQAIRLICSGVFDSYPRLKIILGHLGEALPFWMWRMDNRWVRDGFHRHPATAGLRKKPSQYLSENFFVATSGMFFQPALQCVYQALGADRILFAVDYPNESNLEAVKFMEAAAIGKADKEKIFHGNAEHLFHLSPWTD